jgi:hypothetical protein
MFRKLLKLRGLRKNRSHISIGHKRMPAGLLTRKTIQIIFHHMEEEMIVLHAIKRSL